MLDSQAYDRDSQKITVDIQEVSESGSGSEPQTPTPMQRSGLANTMRGQGSLDSAQRVHRELAVRIEMEPERTKLAARMGGQWTH